MTDYHRDDVISILKSLPELEGIAEKVEESIFKQTKLLSDYKLMIYELLLNPSRGCEKLGWNNEAFETIKGKIKEQDDFIVKPFAVEEGVLECKCGSKRVFSYSKQVRSADEPMTTFASCMSCKKKWTYSG